MGVKAWITVNGNHIPIMDGESKMQAVGRFIKDKRNKSAYNKMYKAQEEFMGRKLTDKEKQQLKDATRLKGVKSVYGNDKTTIKGRAETRGELNRRLRRYNDNMYDFESRGLSEDDAQIESIMANDNRNPYKDYDKSKMAKDYFNDRKYKLKADNYKLSKAESKLQNFAQTSKSEYNISNIKAKELPSGAIHIMTKSGKDISTISPRALTTAEKNDLRRKGILK